MVISMNSNILEYKGYLAKIEYVAEEKILYGKIEGIADLVTFESNSADTVEQEFRSAVDDYLIFCEEAGKEPNKAYKGSFNIRISQELHRQAAMAAVQHDTTLNQVVEDALSAFLTPSKDTSAPNFG